MSKLDYISPKDWPARRPDGQTANAGTDPVPPGKRSSARPGKEKITVRVPTQKARKFKLRCMLLGLKQEDEIEKLLDLWLGSDAGRPDGQTARSDQIDDLKKIDDEENRFLTSSSNLSPGRPDGQQLPDPKRQEVLAYYVELIGNPIRQIDRDFLESVIHLPTHTLKIGIALSLARAQTQIQTLKYCLGAIEEVAELGTGEDYLKSLERVLQREGKLIAPKPSPDPPKQPALPGTSDAGELVELNSQKPQQSGDDQ